MVNARSVWKLVTFDLHFWPWELFLYFLKIQAIYFEWLDLASSFWHTSSDYLGHGLVLRLWVQVKVTAAKNGRLQLKNYWSEIAGA